MSDTFVVKVGQPIYHPSHQPSSLVLVDYFDGRAVFLRKSDEKEDIEDLMEEARKMRKLRLLTIDRNGKPPM